MKSTNRFKFGNNGEQTVVVIGDHQATAKEAKAYLKEAERNATHKIASVDVSVANNDADMVINYKDGARFIRVRRITGYLAPLDAFNNAKRVEVKERIRHA